MVRSFILFACIFLGVAAARAQDTPERQQTGTGGQVVVIEDQGKPQNSGTPAGNTAGQTTESRTDKPSTSAEQPAKSEGGATADENKDEEKPQEARPEAPRVRRVYKKDTTRRVVLRRRAKGSAGPTVARELREGYRIQIFTGGNRRQDRQRADALGEKIRQYFPELSTYSHFVSPRWTCRVGDFEKPEQASRYVSLILRSKVSFEARVIKCMVWLPKK